MRKFVSSKEVYAAQLPDWQHLAVAEAVRNLEDLFDVGFDPVRGCVLLVEPGDKPEDAEPLLGHQLGSKIETTWRRHGCLVGLVLWGNSGDGATIVCPERPHYAEELQRLLRREL